MKTVTLVSQLKNNGIKNNLLLNAFQEVSTVFSGLNNELKRMLFIDSTGFIKPRIVIIAKMLDELDIKKGDKILLIGVDSVYI
ncbi:MAG TPA: hypothetical protein ENK67_04890 [Flavobacteriia bacterium]|nr:hypothetical protein [Flavobacteriia bacterium]